MARMEGTRRTLAFGSTEAELVNLTLAVTSISSWNRLNIAFRVQAGGYRPGMFKQAMGA